MISPGSLDDRFTQGETSKCTVKGFADAAAGRIGHLCVFFMEREAREKLSKGDECAVDIFLHAFFHKCSVRGDAKCD